MMVFGRRPTTPLEKRLGHRFKRSELLQLAITHRSWANEQGVPEHYERLEFLGDSVLGMVTADWLYQRHPELPEGELSKLKAQLVSRTSLAQHAERLDLGPSLLIGVGEERSGGRTKPSLLADSMEAVFGAIYLDGGLDDARKVILAMLEQTGEERTQLLHSDSKTQLQEMTQALGWDLPEYRLAGAAGPDHSKIFTVECLVGGELAGRGEGPSKKMAEQKAAAEALNRVPSLPRR
ncbi:MAG TPA: ribonuclease III [Thermoanaerobaculia bacterium]|jgi:ribonuclease-3|nr:ribonuclease III [Thermoanaerobaculia bacterium]